jgi:hypothetical protein
VSRITDTATHRALRLPVDDKTGPNPGAYGHHDQPLCITPTAKPIFGQSRQRSIIVQLDRKLKALTQVINDRKVIQGMNVAER